jgi:hypothetical protein
MASATSAGSCASGPKGRLERASSTSASMLPCTRVSTAGATVMLLQLAAAVGPVPTPQTSLQQAEIACEKAFNVLYACMLDSCC